MKESPKIVDNVNYQEAIKHEDIARGLEMEDTVDGLLAKIGLLLKNHPKAFRAFRVAVVTFIMGGAAGDVFGQSSSQENAVNKPPATAGYVEQSKDGETISQENLNFTFTRSIYMRLDHSTEYTEKTYDEKMSVAEDLAKKMVEKLDYVTHESQAVLASRLISKGSVAIDDPSTFDAWEDVLKQASSINTVAVSFIGGFSSYDNPEKAAEALKSAMSFSSDTAADNASQIIITHEQLTQNDWSTVDFGQLTTDDIRELYMENKDYSGITPQIVAEKLK